MQPKVRGTNTSLGVAPGGAISMVPAGHCLTLPLWAREDGSGPLEDAVLSAKSVGQMGSGWSAFLLLPRSLQGENTPTANVPLQRKCSLAQVGSPGELSLTRFGVQ